MKDSSLFFLLKNVSWHLLTIKYSFIFELIEIINIL